MRLLTFLLAIVLTIACASRQRTAREAPKPLVERYSSLAEAIRVLPNVQVSGEYVTFRGNTSINGDQEMRFLVDGRIVGTYANAQNLYPLSEIRRVRLIRPQEAAANFGALGSNGLIELVLMP